MQTYPNNHIFLKQFRITKGTFEHYKMTISSLEYNNNMDIAFEYRNLESPNEKKGFLLQNIDKVKFIGQKKNTFFSSPKIKYNPRKNLLLFLNPLDQMAFFQLYPKLSFSSLMFSLPNTYIKSSIQKLKEYYPQKKLITCYPSGYPFNLYDINTYLIWSNKEKRFLITLEHTEINILDTKNNRAFTYTNASISLNKFRKDFKLYPSIKTIKPKKGITSYSKALCKKN